MFVIISLARYLMHVNYLFVCLSFSEVEVNNLARFRFIRVYISRNGILRSLKVKLNEKDKRINLYG